MRQLAETGPPAVIITLMIGLVAANADITIVPLKSPLFPYYLGNVSITQNFHSFLHYVEIDPLIRQVNNIRNYYDQLSRTINRLELNDSAETKHLTLSNLLAHAKFLISEVTGKLNNIISRTRTKRGLINILGHTSKFLFGTMDADDEEKINNAIRELQVTQNSENSQMKMQISLTKQLIDNYNSTITILNSNQLLIKSKLEYFQNTINKTLNSISSYLHALNTLDQVILNCHNLITFLDNLEDAIMFARLNSLHGILSPSYELEKNIDLLVNLYGKSKIPNFKQINSYYSIANFKCNVMFSSNRIIFVVKFPILLDEKFELFQLYPVPIKNSTIIPDHPYLVLGTRNQQTEDTGCPAVEDTYFCQNHLEPLNGCLNALINDAEVGSCIMSKVQMTSPILEKVTEEYVIAIPADQPVKMTKTCHHDEPLVIETPSLIQLPKSCGVQTKEVQFWNRQEKTIGKPIVLPEIKFWESPTTLLPGSPIHLKTVDLEKIKVLQNKARLLQEENTEVHPLLWSSGSSFVILSIVAVTAVSSWLIWKKYWKPRKKADTQIEEEPPRKEEATSENKNVPFCFRTC